MILGWSIGLGLFFHVFLTHNNNNTTTYKAP